MSGRHAELIVSLNQKLKELHKANQRAVQQKVSVFREKLASTVISLTTKLQKAQSELDNKNRILDQSLKAQQILDSNLEKAYNLYHSNS